MEEQEEQAAAVWGEVVGRTCPHTARFDKTIPTGPESTKLTSRVATSSRASTLPAGPGHPH